MLWSSIVAHSHALGLNACAAVLYGTYASVLWLALVASVMCACVVVVYGCSCTCVMVVYGSSCECVVVVSCSSCASCGYLVAHVHVVVVL